jgi:hypothetical protein
MKLIMEDEKISQFLYGHFSWHADVGYAAEQLAAPEVIRRAARKDRPFR